MPGHGMRAAGQIRQFPSRHGRAMDVMILHGPDPPASPPTPYSRNAEMSVRRAGAWLVVGDSSLRGSRHQ